MSLLFERHGGGWYPEDSTRATILRFMSLPQGWHFGQGGPLSPDTVQQALAMLGWGDALGLRSHAFPGPHDEVAIRFHGDTGTVEVIVGSAGVVSVFGDDEDEGVEVGEGASTLEAAYLSLLDLTGSQWHSLASSAYSMSSPTPGSLPVLFSSTFVDETTTVASP